MPRHRLLLTLGFAAGLALRLVALFVPGMFDVDEYYELGVRFLQVGLAHGYVVGAFPIEHQIFTLAAAIKVESAQDFTVVFKSLNLLFDVGTFTLLILLLRQWRANPLYALVYWLHPWFLAVFTLGYNDFHFVFFMLLAVYALGRPTSARYLLAGIGLGVAVFMKPQAMILLVAAAFFAALRWIRTRDLGPAALLAGSAILFVAYEAYFVAALYPEYGLRAASILPQSYLNITNRMPCLTCQMVNLWYPIAYVLKGPGQQVHNVSDELLVLPFISLKYVAAALVLAIVAWQAARVEALTRSAGTSGNGDGESNTRSWVALFGLATLTVPMVMTSAHENHLYAGSVFLVLFLASPLPRSFKLAAHVLLAVQFLNIYGLLGAHPAAVADVLRSSYSQELAVAYSIVSIACYLTMLRAMVSIRPGD